MADEAPNEVRLTGLPIVYANWVRLAPAPFELGIDVGYVAPDTPQEPDLRLVMTWEHAKILQQALTQIVEQREENAGEIKVPPGIVLTMKPTTPEKGAEQ
jgi:hypothetical protein